MKIVLILSFRYIVTQFYHCKLQVLVIMCIFTVLYILLKKRVFLLDFWLNVVIHPRGILKFYFVPITKIYHKLLLQTSIILCARILSAQAKKTCSLFVADELRVNITAWNVSKYGVISDPYFCVFNPNTQKYGPEITPYLDTFHAFYTKYDAGCIVTPLTTKTRRSICTTHTAISLWQAFYSIFCKIHNIQLEKWWSNILGLFQKTLFIQYPDEPFSLQNTLCLIWNKCYFLFFEIYTTINFRFEVWMVWVRYQMSFKKWMMGKNNELK